MSRAWVPKGLSLYRKERIEGRIKNLKEVVFEESGLFPIQKGCERDRGEGLRAKRLRQLGRVRGGQVVCRDGTTAGRPCPCPPAPPGHPGRQEEKGQGRGSPGQARQGGGHSHYSMIKKCGFHGHRASASGITGPNSPSAVLADRRGRGPTALTLHTPRPMACLPPQCTGGAEGQRSPHISKEKHARTPSGVWVQTQHSQYTELLTEPLPHNHLQGPVCWRVRVRKRDRQMQRRGGQGHSGFVLAMTPSLAGSRSHPNLNPTHQRTPCP